MLLGMVEDNKCPETGTAFHPVGNFTELSGQNRTADACSQIPVKPSPWYNSTIISYNASIVENLQQRKYILYIFKKHSSSLRQRQCCSLKCIRRMKN
jgi:hypothetical protein